MSEEQQKDRRLVANLHDAMVACIWTAVVLYGITWLSWGMLVGGKATLADTLSAWSGVSPDVMRIVWLSGVVLVKLTALSFGAMAYFLWLWKRRLAKRIAE
jgi:hypothetical protein